MGRREHDQICIMTMSPWLMRAGWWEPEWVRETIWDSVQVRSVCPSWGGGTRCREVDEPQTCSRGQTDRIGDGLGDGHEDLATWMGEGSMY